MMGMDARSLAVPEGHVELAALAVACGVPPGKFIDGLGVERMAVARAHEDPVALAATAARRLFTTADIDPTTGDAPKNGSYPSGCSLLIPVEETWLP
jgi:hydroxymethylglutaryl-CoA synthase